MGEQGKAGGLAGQDGILTMDDYYRWIVGVGILALSLVFTGFLGILQDLSYRSFGQHWQEALFYAVRSHDAVGRHHELGPHLIQASFGTARFAFDRAQHFLGLPLFITLGPEIWNHMVLWSTQHPVMWVVLALNTLTSFLCVRGMYNLTGACRWREGRGVRARAGVGAGVRARAGQGRGLGQGRGVRREGKGSGEGRGWGECGAGASVGLGPEASGSACALTAPN